MKTKTSKPTPGKSTRVLAVRMLVARTDWLEGHLRWAEGRIAWGKGFVPEAADLARAQRCLHKLARYPYAARVALGDRDAWLARRQARLELAKRLRELPGAELAQWAERAHQGNAEAAAPLVALLVAEALCLNALPVSPCAALLTFSHRAAAASLNGVVQDTSLPLTARALAALTLGAIARASEENAARPIGANEVWVTRAYQWGLQHGLPDEAPLIVTLLADADGNALARRYLATSAVPTPFRVSPETLREWLAEGVGAETVVGLAEAAVAVAPVRDRIMRYREGLPPPGTKSDRRNVSESLRAEREAAVGELVPIFAEYARLTRDPALVRAVTTVALRVYTLADASICGPWAFGDLHEAVLSTLRAGLTLETPQIAVYLRLLTELHADLWDIGNVPTGAKVQQEIHRFRAWLRASQRERIEPILILLRQCGDSECVERALKLGVTKTLAGRKWTDPALYSFALTVLDQIGQDDDFSLWRVWHILGAFSTAREARAAFGSILHALVGKDSWLRHHFLEMALSELGNTRQTIRERLPRLAPFLRALIAFAEAESDEMCLCGAVIGGALALAEAAPAQAAERVNWLLAFLEDSRKHRPFDYEQRASLEIGLSAAVTLAAEDGDAFQSIVRTAMAHHFQQDGDQIKRGLALLVPVPSLRAPLAHLFPLQPQRCAELLVRLGLTSKLNTDVGPLLAQLEPQRDGFPIRLCPDNGWWQVHCLAPEWTPTANAFLHAQAVMGKPLAVPPGVRRALETPQRLAQELAHVEQREDLAVRAAKLRVLLADEAALTVAVRADVGVRLTQATAEVQVAAAERQILACYRTRLAAITGPLPDNLDFSNDLINATLLSVEIVQNRRLLRRLLRAHLAGERDWREQHPANRAFLERARARGTNTDAWLSEYRRRYRCESAPGKTVHLHLERDPLHILQMGNYFDTCLSFGGFNAFSTVANACELNKRVVYARDGFGRIVGRKLIGINTEGELVGFHTYAALTDETGSRAVRAIMRRYVARFAADCGLTLSETGTVPTLLAEAWYDDGLAAWNEDDSERPPKTSPKQEN
ncbi:MAG: hypothetical protein M3Y28_02520 [Armatimonadota bacterium]|nr:hypothetical protein [Armatimonadota bacterium]